MLNFRELLNLKFFVKSLLKDIQLYEGDNDRPLFVFKSDVRINRVAISSTSVIATGDNVGQVHFLQPNRALRRLMGLETDEAGKVQ